MSGAPAHKGRLCPICGKPTETAYRPFCSRRCADIDLGRWLTGGYVIEGAPEEDQTDLQDADEPRH